MGRWLWCWVYISGIPVSDYSCVIRRVGKGGAVRACSSCGSYLKGVCWLHGVVVRGTTLGRECFKARRGGVQQGGKEGKA
jgi:hypothetical protein